MMKEKGMTGVRKKLIMLTCGICLALTMASCGHKSGAERTQQVPSAEEEETSVSDTSSEETANPFLDCETMADAEKIAGITMTCPDNISGYTSRQIQATKDGLLQVYFQDAAGDNYILIRKEKGDDDISGDSSDYKVEEQVQIGDVQVEERGDGDTISSVIWTDGGYSYSVGAEAPVDAVQMEEIVAQVK